jgi:hypothetical protein
MGVVYDPPRGPGHTHVGSYFLSQYITRITLEQTAARVPRSKYCTISTNIHGQLLE